MKFTFTLGPADVAAINRVIYRRLAWKASAGKLRFGLLILNIATWLAVAFAGASYMSLYEGHSQLAPYLNGVLFCLGIAATLFVVSHFYRQHLYLQAMHSNTRWLAPTSVTATPERLEIETPIVYTRYEWSSFTDYIEDEAMLYLFLDVSWAVGIPKKAFAAPEELQQFRSWVESSNKLLQPIAAKDAAPAEQ